MALALILVLMPFGETGADEPEVEANFGFVPNSWDASVSKVDLVDFEEVARYYTAPRDGVDVRSWRTNRIAMDADGNAWALNTGTDAHRYGPDEGLQGQVVRIQGDTAGLANTHAYDLDNPDSTPPLAFDTDEAVQVFDVGGVNDMPRAIAVDAEGYIWVGFYGSGELHQYAYDEADGDLILVGEPFTREDRTIRYYEMKFAPNGDLFISSRSSTPSVSGNFGIYRFDGDEFFHEEDFNSPYALLVAPDGTVYATSYNKVLRIRDTDGDWSQVTIGDAQNLRGMQLDGLGNLWIASTTGAGGGNRVIWYELGTGNSGFVTLEDGNTPVGVGRDAAGLMWAICRTDDNKTNGFIEAIDPATKEVVGSIEVGPRPYAYGDFVVEAPPTGCLEVTKAWTGEYDAADLPDYVEVKVYSDSDKTAHVTTLTLEPEEWKDQECGLAPGTYYVEEVAVEGFSTSYSPEDFIEVVAGQTLTIEITNDFEDEKCYGSETAWAYGGENYADPIWNHVRANNWGWTNGPLSEGSYEFEIYTGAGQNDIEKGTLVGTLYVDYEDGTVEVKYELDEGYYLGETHLWVGDDVLPEVRRGRNSVYTNAPGQFPYGEYLGFDPEDLSEGKTEWEWSGDGFEGDIYIAAHSVVWMEVECE